jgi:hypothetical protein
MAHFKCEKPDPLRAMECYSSGDSQEDLMDDESGREHNLAGPPLSEKAWSDAGFQTYLASEPGTAEVSGARQLQHGGLPRTLGENGRLWLLAPRRGDEPRNCPVKITALIAPYSVYAELPGHHSRLATLLGSPRLCVAATL